MDPLFCNSLTDGDFGNGFPLRQSLVEGDFWTRRLGCYSVYCGVGNIDDIDYSNIVATCTSAGSLTLPGYISHSVDTDYYYAVRRASVTGQQERGTMAVVKLSLDDEGNQRANRPNCVRNLRAEAVSGGKIRLYWWYQPLGQKAVPDHFDVFGDNGTGTIDYESVLARIDYQGVRFYSYLSQSGDDGKCYRFSVRGVDADGVGDGNCAYVEAVVDLRGPDEVEGVASDVEL